MLGLFKSLAVIERAVTAVAATLSIAIMLIVTCDVALRYLFNSPLTWAYDLISLYLMAAVFFLVLGDAHRAGAHVGVDILQQRFPPAARRLSALVTDLVGLAVFCLIAWFGGLRALDAFESADVVAGAIPWPTWPSLALVPIGCGLIAVRLALHAAADAISLARGRDVATDDTHAQENFE